MPVPHFRSLTVLCCLWLVSSRGIARPDLATSVHVPGGPDGTRVEELAYGYYLWLVPGSAMFSGWGHGGQYVLVHPEQRMVIAKNALPDSALHGDELREFLALVEPIL